MLEHNQLSVIYPFTIKPCSPSELNRLKIFFQHKGELKRAGCRAQSLKRMCSYISVTSLAHFLSEHCRGVGKLTYDERYDIFTRQLANMVTA